MSLSSINPRHLTRLRRICLALPEVAEKEAWGDPTWRVNDRIFAMQKGNHEDGRPSVWFKASDGEQSVLVVWDAERYFVPPYVGQKGWVGLYLDVPVRWNELTEHVAGSYRLVAPRKLVARLDSSRT